jgi:prepilin-type N-terminal cleavage/methylation domain-containing protein
LVALLSPDNNPTRTNAPAAKFQMPGNKFQVSPRCALANGEEPCAKGKGPSKPRPPLAPYLSALGQHRPLPLAPYRLPLCQLRGFTLIELLTVMAVIGVLVSIAITAGRGIQERSKIAQAKAEMAVLASALEQYKAHYGDYPWTPGESSPPLEGGAIMFNALCGMMGPKATLLQTRGKMFVELSRFTLANGEVPNPDTTATVRLVNWFNDPWSKEDNSNWYYYRYKTAANDANWKSAGFLLYSHGPDGRCFLGSETELTAPVRTGLLENMPDSADAIRDNADNIYYGRE